MNWPNSKFIFYSQREKPRHVFGYTFVGLHWKRLKWYPTVHSYFFFFITLYCIVSTEKPATWKSAKCTLRLFKVWRNWPNSKFILYSQREEPRHLFGYAFVGIPWKLLKLYPAVYSYFFFSSYCIVLFPLRTLATWKLTKCTRRLFKVWRNRPNSGFICYSQSEEPRHSFVYKFVGLPWKLLKLYQAVYSY